MPDQGTEQPAPEAVDAGVCFILVEEALIAVLVETVAVFLVMQQVPEITRALEKAKRAPLYRHIRYIDQSEFTIVQHDNIAEVNGTEQYAFFVCHREEGREPRQVVIAVRSFLQAVPECHAGQQGVGYEMTFIPLVIAQLLTLYSGYSFSMQFPGVVPEAQCVGVNGGRGESAARIKKLDDVVIRGKQNLFAAQILFQHPCALAQAIEFFATNGNAVGFWLHGVQVLGVVSGATPSRQLLLRCSTTYVHAGVPPGEGRGEGSSIKQGLIRIDTASLT